jgi:hypothetical protein
VFTARYALSPYIKQIRFVFKRLNLFMPQHKSLVFLFSLFVSRSFILSFKYSRFLFLKYLLASPHSSPHNSVLSQSVGVHANLCWPRSVINIVALRNLYIILCPLACTGLLHPGAVTISIGVLVVIVFYRVTGKWDLQVTCDLFVGRCSAQYWSASARGVCDMHDRLISNPFLGRTLEYQSFGST